MIFLFGFLVIYLGIGFAMMIIIRIEDVKIYKKLYENTYQSWGNLLDSQSFRPRWEWAYILFGVPILLMSILEK